MSVLVVSENSNNDIKSSTLNCIFAASNINKDIEVLVIGNDCEEVARKLSKIKFMLKNN